MVVGGFVYCFGFAIGSFYLSKNNNTYEKFFFSIFLTLIPLTVFITGERSNFIKSSLLFLLLITFINRYRLFFNKKIIISCLILVISLFLHLI